MKSIQLIVNYVFNNKPLGDAFQDEVTQSEKGNYFEKLWDIVLKLGNPDFPGELYEHYEGNINAHLKQVTNLDLYFNKLSVFSKNKGGASDITMRNKETGKWTFVSCKFFASDKSKRVTSYEVQDINSVIKNNPHKGYEDYQVCLLVNNKKHVYDKMKRSQKDSSSHITNKIAVMYDFQDLEVALQRLRATVIKNNLKIEDLNRFFCNDKVDMNLRFHQELFCHETMKRIGEGHKQFLWGWKCRSGKSIGCAGLIVEYAKRFDKVNVLVVTPAPKETMPQFTDDLFHTYRDFIGYNIIEIKSSQNIKKHQLSADRNIIVVSKQLLDGYVGDKALKNLRKFDMIIVDETHHHGTTEMSNSIMETYSDASTVKLYLTATYNKPLRKWDISEECQFYWNIEDELMCKKRDIVSLQAVHGDAVTLFVNDSNKKTVLGSYDKMPDLHLITNIMDSERYEAIKQRIKDTCYGFSLNTLFSMNKDQSQFMYVNEITQFLRYISGSHKDKDFKAGDKSIFGRIKKVAAANSSRTLLDNSNFTSQLWFLPYGMNMNIDKVSESLKKLMLNDPVLKRHEVMIINSKGEYKLTDLKKEIANAEIKAKHEGKDGLILLAGNQCTLGITLPLVDVVMLLNNNTDGDKIMQMMYRCMTESPQGDKKMGFVVDLKISRVLNTVIEYNMRNSDYTIEDQIRNVVEKNIINIDADLFDNKENKTKLVEKLVDLWKTDPVNNIKALLHRIENDVMELDTEDQRSINKYFTPKGGCGMMNVEVSYDDEADQELPEGKGSSDENLDKSEAGSSHGGSEKNTDKILTVSLSKDVLPFVLPLSCVLTMDNTKYDFMDMIDTIKENPDLLGVFNDQSFVWWNNENVIDIIRMLVQKYIRKNSNTYSIALQFKMSLRSLIDRPNDVLELIDSCLKPKQEEKQKNGEVFTPMHLINEQLDRLDEHYMTQHEGDSIFKQEEYKWFDPASGMGNYPIAVYMRLMEGLKSKIADVQERKKHILENMLYMSELNKKNCYVCKQIFDVNKEYNMNVYEGDTLKLDVKEQWGVDKFDVVMGNPPYNKGGIRSHTGAQLGEKNETIWPLFVTQAFELLRRGGYLVFITPLSWLRVSHSQHDKMLKKHVVWLTLWDNSHSLSVINADIPISLYIINNHKNSDKMNTDIMSHMKRRHLVTSNSVYLDPALSVPLAYHNIFDKLWDFIQTNTMSIDVKKTTIKGDGKSVCIPDDYTLDDKYAVDTFTLKEGIKVKVTKDIHPDANKRKLIIANKASFAGAFIDDGRLGLCGNHKFYILGEDLEKVHRLLNFKIMSIVCHYTKYGQDFVDNKVFQYIPDMRKMNLEYTENEFYEMVGFTEDEINVIMNAR